MNKTKNKWSHNRSITGYFPDLKWGKRTKSWSKKLRSPLQLKGKREWAGPWGWGFWTWTPLIHALIQGLMAGDNGFDSKVIPQIRASQTEDNHPQNSRGHCAKAKTGVRTPLQSLLTELICHSSISMLWTATWEIMTKNKHKHTKQNGLNVYSKHTHVFQM